MFPIPREGPRHREDVVRADLQKKQWECCLPEAYGAKCRSAAHSAKIRRRSENHSCSTRSCGSACFRTNRPPEVSNKQDNFETPPASSLTRSDEQVETSTGEIAGA